MTTPTTKLALSKPMGNEINNRTAFNALIDQIDATAMKDSLFCKSAVYNSGTSKIDVTFSPGVAMFLQTIVNKSVDSVYSIPSPSINTSYFIYLSSAGAFSSNTTGIEVDGAVLLWKVSTGSVLTTISTLDLRGIVDGSAQMVKDLLNAHQIAADPHSQYSLDTDLTTHKLAATLDHPDGSVTDAKFGNRTIDDTVAAASGADTPTRLWSKLGNIIKQITGGANWYTAPTTTLAALLTAVGLRAPINNAVFTGTTTLAADPASALQAATKQYNDAFVNTSPAPTALNPVYGQQVVTAKASPFNVINICGCTLVNMVGRDGNMQNISRWSDGGVTHSADTSNFVLGTQSIKMTLGGTSGYMVSTTTFNLVSTNYYILLCDIKNGNATTAGAVITSQAPTAGTSTSDTTKFVTVYGRYTGINATNATVSPTMGGTAGQFAYFAAMRMYQVTLAQYNAVGSLTQAQLTAQYPYVDDVKHVNSPYINRIGENMLPPFNEYGTIHANATVMEPYKLTLVATGNGQASFTDVPCVASTQYTLSLTHNAKFAVQFRDSNNAFISSNAYTTLQTQTFTIPSNAAYVRIVFDNDTLGSGTYTFSNPRLNIGAVDKGFKPRNDDYLYFPNQSLASSVDGTVFDQIYRSGDKWIKENRFVKDFVLDGSLTWAFLDDQTGRKRIQIAGFTGIIPTNVNSVAVKYDGKNLVNGADTAGADGFNYYNPGIVISIADTDSGWGESYTPSAGEIQAYFYGWVMTTQETWNTNPVPYNGTGTKGWVRRWISTAQGGTPQSPSSIGLIISGTGVASVPTTMSSGFTPYKLTYQLAAPTFEEIAAEGSISTLEGSNQIEVGNGMIVREKATAYLNGGYYEINRSILPLKYRTVKNLAVYKNGKLDSTWVLQTNQTSTYWNGTAGAYTVTPNYDTSATYEITYLALDQYTLTVNVQTINGEYNSNIKTIVDSTVQNVSDIGARLSVVENNKARKVQSQMIVPTLLGTWSGSGVGYYKNEFNEVVFKGTLTGGTTTNGTQIATMPIGLRPVQTVRIPLANHNSGVTTIYPCFIAFTNIGQVLIYGVGSNDTLALDGVRYLAEQ